MGRKLGSDAEEKVIESDGDKKKQKTERKKGSLFSIGNIILAIISLIFVGAILVVVTEIAEMAKLNLAIFLVIAILVVLVVAAGIYSIYVFFAPRDLFFTGVREGTAKMIMAGTKENPKFVRAEINYEGFKLNQDNKVIPGEEKRSLLPGIRFIGIPGIHWIWNYNFDWSSMLQNGEIKPHKELLNHISLRQDIYVTKLLEAETGESMVPVNVVLLITAKVINPYKALFGVENWLEFVINRVKVPVRDYIAEQENPRDLITRKDELGKLFHKQLEESGDLEEFKKEIGIEVLKVETFDIDLGKLQEVATAKWEAEQKGDAEIAKQTKEGDAYMAKRTREKEADMDYLDGVYGKVQEFGDLGTTLRFLDTLTKAAEGPGNTIIPFGMIQDIARQVLGTKSSEIAGLFGEGITKEDIESLKEVIKTMKEANKEE